MDISQAKEILGMQFSFTVDDANHTIQYLKLPQNAKILDVGTGMGYFAITLALNGYNVLTGEPESDKSIYAKKDWINESKKVGVDHLIEFKNFDARNMLFDDNTFDAVFFFGVLHHVDEELRAKVLQEAARTSKPDGVVCFIEPNSNGIKIVLEHDPSHPPAAEPDKYAKGMNNLSFEKKEGSFFDSFIFKKV